MISTTNVDKSLRHLDEKLVSKKCKLGLTAFRNRKRREMTIPNNNIDYHKILQRTIPDSEHKMKDVACKTI